MPCGFRKPSADASSTSSTRGELRTATILPAEFMGLGGKLGQIAEGYWADLVLLSANPFEDIANTQAIASVILRGETVLDAVALRDLLRSVAR